MDNRIPRPSYCFERKQTKDAIAAPHSLRVYNYAPGLVMLQVRGSNSYHGVTLTRDDAKTLRALVDAALADMVPSEVEA